MCIVGMSIDDYNTYKRNYEFNKRAPVRAPTITDYDYKFTKEYSTGKEHDIVCGNPHRFKGIRTGNSYGKRKAMCRIPSNPKPRY